MKTGNIPHRYALQILKRYFTNKLRGCTLNEHFLFERTKNRHKYFQSKICIERRIPFGLKRTNLILSLTECSATVEYNFNEIKTQRYRWKR